MSNFVRSNSIRPASTGIAPENQETIFEEFRQVGTDYSKKREGTGLGLTLTEICRTAWREDLGGKLSRQGQYIHIYSAAQPREI